jgi:hypothetical protein
VGLAAALVIHFICFYWWVSGVYYFSGDGLFYFSRQITSFSDLWSKFLSLDEYYQYRPFTFVFFSFVLHPLFGANPWAYHLASYFIALLNILLACGCCYLWLRRDPTLAWIASVFLILNPVNFFPSYGLTYLDVWLSVLFYLLSLLLILANTRWTPYLAPVFAALALLSRESSVVLPLQAMLILLATGVSLRATLGRTRNVWLVLAAYCVLQLIVRQGSIFAPETANANLQFGFSAERLEQLVEGMRPAIFFPESPHLNESLHDFRRYVRLLFVIPWLVMMAWAWFRRDKIALSGLVWVPAALLPVVFINVTPFPRHYYLALPGLAVLFACFVRKARVMAYVGCVFAVVTVVNVAMYAQDSWVAVGSRLTKNYIQEIESTVIRSGRTDFYFLNEGDRYFQWHVDSGTPVRQILKRNLSFRFAENLTPLPMDQLLSNSVNVVIPTWYGFSNALVTGRFPKFTDTDLCGPMRRLTASEGQCAVFFRGLAIEDATMPVVETPNGMPIIDRDDEIVTLSRTTVFIKHSGHIRVEAQLRVSQESRDGVVVQVFASINGRFNPVFRLNIGPGERVHLNENFELPPASIFVLRISPGANGDESGDWLIWEIANGKGSQ